MRWRVLNATYVLDVLNVPVVLVVPDVLNVPVVLVVPDVLVVLSFLSLCL